MPNLNGLLRKPRGTALVALAAVAALSGCLKNATDEFPDGITPIDPVNTATFPATCTEGMGVIPKAEAIENSYWRGNGKAYIHASLDDVYKAMQYWQLGAERLPDGVTQPPNLITPSQDTYADRYPIDFTVHHVNEVTLLKLNIEFDITWRYGFLAGTPGSTTDPLRDQEKPFTPKDRTNVIGSRHKKTNGTTHIQVMEGSVLAYPAPTCDTSTDHWTAIEVIRHLQDDDPGGQSKVAKEAACWSAYYFYSLHWIVNNVLTGKDTIDHLPADPRDSAHYNYNCVPQ